MALFIEVDSIEKGCPVIINLDSVIEIAPLKEGGSSIFYADSAAVNGKTAMKVKNSYNDFKQFAMQTVSSEDIQNRIDAIHKASGTEPPKKTKAIKIPKFDGTVEE